MSKSHRGRPSKFDLVINALTGEKKGLLLKQITEVAKLNRKDVLSVLENNPDFKEIKSDGVVRYALK